MHLRHLITETNHRSVTDMHEALSLHSKITLPKLVKTSTPNINSDQEVEFHSRKIEEFQRHAAVENEKISV